MSHRGNSMGSKALAYTFLDRKFLKYRPLHVAMLAAGLVGAAASSHAADAVNLGNIEVQSDVRSGGLMVNEEAPKSRSTVTGEALKQKPGSNNAVQTLNTMPGVHVTTSDAAGMADANFTMRGFNSDQIGFTVDGAPVNDSGNFAIYPTELGDIENLQQIFVTQGSTDTDAPHIGASGGNIGLISVLPTKEFGVFAEQIVGNHNLRKSFARINTGELDVGFGKLRTWLSASHTGEDKWRENNGGGLRANRFEMKSVLSISDGNSLDFTFKYNQQHNYQFSKLSLPQFNAGNVSYTNALIGSNGKPDVNYYKFHQNPFENYLAVLSGKFKLADNLRLTVTPYFWYGDGGGSSGQSGWPAGALQTQSLPNGARTDVFYKISNTTTYRPGVTTTLQTSLGANDISLGYWIERSRQMQTGPFIPVDQSGNPFDAWGKSNALVDKNGNIVQADGRNRYTVSLSQKFFLQDSVVLSDKLSLQAGVSYDRVRRTGDDFGTLAKTGTQDIKASKDYSEVLPSLGLKYQLDQSSHLFYNATHTFRAPQNYTLFDFTALPNGTVVRKADQKPETAWSQELGWRYSTERAALSTTLFYIDFRNRQAQMSDVDGTKFNYNVGQVINKGLELEGSYALTKTVNAYGSYSYTSSVQQENFLNNGTLLPTKGKQFGNIPRQMLSASLGYDDKRFFSTFTGKYTSSVYGDLTNDQKIGGFTLFDLTAGYRFEKRGVMKGATLTLAGLNLFNKQYLASVDSVVPNSVAYGKVAASTPYYVVGGARAVSLTLTADF
ncbi:TonB-dependent receptor [Paraherbaspirillum soli]|uniref:TonB-dependent receptor n=1 Tax=Paraherbaspirillum soli TaxID=631222 RepID=A0ABW0M653_9BURK